MNCVLFTDLELYSTVYRHPLLFFSCKKEETIIKQKKKKQDGASSSLFCGYDTSSFFSIIVVFLFLGAIVQKQPKIQRINTSNRHRV